ncbi:MAG: DNA polymerase III subunit beta [Deltaproteobacteria bacterium]|nr:DNA polymerase III subunit beta [Deltaproteobacteria bacterium]
MQFKMNRKKLLDVLNLVQAITGKKTNFAITSHVLLRAKKNVLDVIATDLDMTFKGTYEADIVEEGSNAVPSRKFFEIVKEFPSEEVIVEELKNKWIYLHNNNVEYHLVGMEPDEFPQIPSIEAVKWCDLDAQMLKNMIEKTIYAVFSDQGRAQIAGVFLETENVGENTVIRMVSTDGHRLSKVDSVIEQGTDFSLDHGIIIPRTAVVEILKLLEDGSRIAIGVQDKYFIAKKDSETLIVSLIDGEFPDYKLVVPQKCEKKIILQKDSFLMMLRRMSILSSEKYRGVVFRFEKEKLETIATNPEIGESREIIPITYGGPLIELAFNPKYFLDTVTRMKSDQVVIATQDEATPCIVSGEGDPGFLSVIMPMTI